MKKYRVQANVLPVEYIRNCKRYSRSVSTFGKSRATKRTIAVRAQRNASARLIYASRRTEHVTPLLRDLHWLRYPDRIDYKLAVLVYGCLNGLAPSYLADEFTRVSEIVSRRNLRPAPMANLVFSGRHSAVVHSLRQRLKHRTAYRHMAHHFHRWRLSKATSRLSCS